MNNLKTTEQIVVSFSPYTYARIAAMKGSLFKKDDYNRLLKMGFNESLRFLQDSSYKKEIDEFDVQSEGLKLIEHALNANVMRVFSKLHRISEDGLKATIAKYLLRYDLKNIKSIARSKRANLTAEEVQPLLYNSVNFNTEFWQKLLNQSSLEALGKELPFMKWKPEYTDLFTFENALDRYYINQMYDFASSIGGEGKEFIQFLLYEIDLLNIKTIIRFIGEEEKIDTHLIRPSTLVQKVAKQKTIEDITNILRKKKHITLTGDEKNLLEQLEIQLEVNLLKKERMLMHRNMLNASYILGFMFAKEIEVRNLKVLIKGKKLDLPLDLIEKMLVISR